MSRDGSTGHSQPQFSTSSRTPASTTSLTGVSSGKARGDDEGDDRQQPQSYDDHWASPTEVLEMRALWDSVVQKHNIEMSQLRDSLAASEREKAMLFAEVKETERLKEQYAKARTSFESMRQERSQWQEEREMLMLRLQRMANEIERLRGAADSAGIGSSSSSSGFGSGGGGSTATSLSSSATPVEELCQLLEQLHRQGLELNAIEQRFEFQTVVHQIEIARLHRNSLAVTAENERLRASHRILQDGEEQTKRALRYAQEEARNMRDELQRLREAIVAGEARRTEDIAIMERQWEAQWNEDVSTKQAEWGAKERRLEEENSSLRIEMARTTKKLEETQRQLEQEVSSHQTTLQDSDDRCRKVQQELQMAKEALAEFHRTSKQELFVAREEARVVTTSRDELQNSLRIVLEKVEQQSKEYMELQQHFERQGQEFVKHRNLVDQLRRDLNQALIGAGERETYKIRAVQLEEEVGVQREFYEKQLRVLHHAVTALQKQKRAEGDTMLREIVTLRKRSSSPRAKKREKQQTAARKEEKQQDDAAQQQNRVTAATDDFKDKVDPLEMLKKTMIQAERIQQSVRR